MTDIKFERAPDGTPIAFRTDGRDDLGRCGFVWLGGYKSDMEGSKAEALAALAREAGHRVTGCDANVYPPMSTQLEALGIELTQGFTVDQVDLRPDVFVIGNVVSRGNALMEEILNRGLPYISGPQWVGENVLAGRHVLDALLLRKHMMIQINFATHLLHPLLLKPTRNYSQNRLKIHMMYL